MMKHANAAALFVATAALTGLTTLAAGGCGAEGLDLGEPPAAALTLATAGGETVEQGAVEAKQKPKNCSGTQGCKYAACYDGCIGNHTSTWCTWQCTCIAYGGKGWVTCESENPYIDLMPVPPVDPLPKLDLEHAKVLSSP